MRIALISPAGLITGDGKLNDIFAKHPNIKNYTESLTKAFSSGLLLIGALTPRNIETKLIDENCESIDFSEPFDLVGISAMTQQASRAYEIADRFRSQGATVVFGGIHATTTPEEAIKHFDSVFVGEAEETWPVFLKDFQNNRIAPFYRSKRLADLTKSPMPRYDLLKKDCYRVIWLQTGRGCPHDCEFCAASRIYGLRYRHKSIKQIVDEVTLIHNTWPNAHINFSDDNLFLDRKFSKELFKHLRNLDFRWFAQTDVSVANDEPFLDELREAGCTTLFIGFETVSEKSLSLVNKKSWKLRQLKNYSKAIARIQAKGIGIIGAFIIGFDEDTNEIFDDLADFVIRNNIFIPQIAILTPLPGTRVYERLKEEGRLLNNPWSQFTFTEVNFVPKNMTIDELRSGLYYIYERVYAPDVRRKVLLHFKSIFKKNYCERR